MPRRHPLFFLAVAVTTTLLPGCFEAQSCNMVYAPEGLLLTFTGDVLEDGSYTIEVDGLSCSFSLGGSAEDTGEEFGGGCESLATDGNLLVTVLDDAPQLLQASLSRRAPASVAVRLLQDGEERLNTTLAPDYVVDEPNGEGCGERSFAREELALD